MHEELVNRLGGLSLPRKSVVRLTDRQDMTLDVYRGCKTTIQPTNPPPLSPYPPTEKIIHLCIILWILVQSNTVNDLILFGGQCDLYIMVQRFCLVSLTIHNRKTSYRSLKQTAGWTILVHVNPLPSRGFT